MYMLFLHKLTYMLYKKHISLTIECTKHFKYFIFAGGSQISFYHSIFVDPVFVCFLNTTKNYI